MSYLIGAGIAILGVFILAAVVQNRGPLDDTDNKLTGERSNMRILIDHGTGCQYLQSAGGGITPRLGAKGAHMCVKVPA